MNIGFIGTGRMGSNMAANLLRAGHRVAVHDARQASTDKLVSELGAIWAATPAEAARGAEVVFTSLPGPADVEAVATGPNGILDAMAPGSTYVDLSTNAPSTVRKLEKLFTAKGVGMLDGPVSGGVTGAEKGTLSIMVGGDRATYDRVEPVLKNIGAKLFHCGGIGNGSVTKLCNNIMGQGYAVIIAEALTLGVKAGVDLQTLVDVISVSTGTSPRMTSHFKDYLFKGNFTPMFSVGLSAKDTRLAVELAHELGVPMAMGEVVHQDMQQALAMGLADLDFDAVAMVQEERTGIQLRLIE